MKVFSKNTKIDALKKGRLNSYLIYAIGEVLLIIIGILIAVAINNEVKKTQDKALRCTYLNELLYTFDYDIKDVEDNIGGFKRWNPQIQEIFDTLNNKGHLSEIDSFYDKLGVVGNFIFFGQRSKTKIEELKYSTTNLIVNRSLKNKILLYQDNNIAFIRVLEKKYDLLEEDLKHYYLQHFRGFNYGRVFPVDVKKLEQDNRYFTLVTMRLKMNYTLQAHYERLKKEQVEIRTLIIEELEVNCDS